MKRPETSFVLALLLSLLLHAAAGLLWAGLGQPQARERPAKVMLEAVLASPSRQAQAQPPLFLPEPPRPVPQARPPDDAQSSGKGSVSKRRAEPNEEAVRQASAQVARSLLYPPEAIARGLEGETLVLLFLDDAGNVVAARVERGSGHAILDEAAMRAARTVRSLPGTPGVLPSGRGTAREVLLPVRFRLR